ncbi:MAG TPA: hypothetical protein VMT24_15340 [Aggregatilineaceae bacterium]|nr:hypothetical protein [Aggregatilineaceae bacterium]
MAVRRGSAGGGVWAAHRPAERDRAVRHGVQPPDQPAFWDTKSVDGPTQDFQRWIYSALGATVAGWGVFLAFLAHTPFKRRERWARDCMAAGIGLWFVLDTAVSLYHRVYFNALAVNVPLLLIVALPLWFTRREFAE